MILIESLMWPCWVRKRQISLPDATNAIHSGFRKIARVLIHRPIFPADSLSIDHLAEVVTIVGTYGTFGDHFAASEANCCPADVVTRYLY